MNAAAIPPAFRARFSEHNQQAILVSFLTAGLAAICWALLYAVVHWASLFLSTVVRGVDAAVPAWMTPAFFITAAALLLLAALDCAFGRFSAIRDRPILGLHLIKDILLFLPRLTFAVFGNLMALRVLSRDDLQRAWTLLQRIRQERRADFFLLSQVEPDARRLHHLLLALQVTGFIDLHRGEEAWYYIVRGDQVPLIQEMMKIED